MVTLTIRGRSFTPTNPCFKEFPWWDRWGWFRDTVTLTMMVTSIKYSAGLSRGPGPIRNCISSPWELQLFREGTLLLLLWSFVNNNTMMIISQWLQRDDSIYDNDDDDDDKKQMSITCFTPLHTGHPSLLACQPNSYLDIPLNIYFCRNISLATKPFLKSKPRYNL